MYYTIYETKNLITEQIYVGQHVTDNLEDGYLGSGIRLINSVNKYGKTNFAKRILHIYDNFNDMDKKEEELVDLEFVKRADTLNVILGGSSGAKFTVVVSYKHTPDVYFRILSSEYDPEVYTTPTSGTLCVYRISDGKKTRITSDEYRLNRHLYRTTSSGKVTIEHMNSNITESIPLEDFDEKKHKKVFGGIVVKDNGVTRYATAEEYYNTDHNLIHTTKNTVTVTVIATGEKKHVTVDEFYANRDEYLTNHQGKVLVRHKINGESKLVNCDDVHLYRDEWAIGTEGQRTVYSIPDKKFMNISVDSYNSTIHKLAQDKKAICYNADGTIKFEFWGNKKEFLELFKVPVSIWDVLRTEGTVTMNSKKTRSFNGCYFKLIDWKKELDTDVD